MSTAIKKLVDKPRLRLREADKDLVQAYSAPTSPASNVGVLNLTSDDVEATSVKRGWTEPIGSSIANGTEIWTEGIDLRGKDEMQATNSRKRLRKIDQVTRNLSILAKEGNIKKEIKEAVAELSSLVRQISTSEVQVLLQRLG